MTVPRAADASAPPRVGRSWRAALAARGRKYAHDARTLPADLRNAWRRDGLGGAWQEIAYRSVYRLVKCSRHVAIVQDVSKIREVLPPPGVTITAFAGPDWAVLAPLATGRLLAYFARIRVGGRTCLVAWREGRPVGYAWCSPRMEPDVETYSLPLGPDGCYLWDLYVVPAERNGGIGTALAHARLAWAREHGFRKGWRVVSPRNAPSLRTVSKTARGGTIIAGDLWYVKILARQFVWYRPRSSPELVSSAAQ
jgi:GNAT superfamily N-acetyltransferase